jgi:hypothetical protein
MTEPLKFEKDKHYRTRDGRKVLCAYVWTDGQAAMLDTAESRQFCLVRANGCVNKDGYSTSWDIVAEWREPRQWTVYVYERPDKTCVPILVGPAHVSSSLTLLARVTVTEGEGLE